MMHFIAVVNASAGCFKYMLPASDVSCLVTQRAMAATTLLYDVRQDVFVGMLIGCRLFMNGLEWPCIFVTARPLCYL